MIRDTITGAAEAACADCGAAVPVGDRFCGTCGTPVASTPSSGASGTGGLTAFDIAVPSPVISVDASRPSGVAGSAAEEVGGVSRVLAGRSRFPIAWRSALTVMFNPGQVVKSMMAVVAPQFALGISGAAFTLFFLQTGLDLARAGSADIFRVALLAALGAVYGSLGVALVAGVAWALSKPFGGGRSVDWTVRAFALGYSPTLIYAFLGLLFNVVLGWNTAVAFGVTGVLWAMGPMVATLREMLGGKTNVSVVLATVCGGLLLFGWAMLGRWDFRG